MASRTYAGASADERRSVRRAGLIEAAVDLMAEHGVGSLTVRTVAAAAGLSSRYLYESFADLDELRAAAFDDSLVRVVGEAFDAVLAVPGDLESRLDAIFATLVRYARTNPNRARLLLSISLGDPALAARRAAMTRDMAIGFAAFVQAHLPAPASKRRAVLVAQMVVGATAEVVAVRLDSGASTLTPALAREVRDLALGLLHGLAVEA